MSKDLNILCWTCDDDVRKEFSSALLPLSYKHSFAPGFQELVELSNKLKPLFILIDEASFDHLKEISFREVRSHFLSTPLVIVTGSLIEQAAIKFFQIAPYEYIARSSMCTEILDQLINEIKHIDTAVDHSFIEMGPTCSVLITDDNEDDQELCRRLLSKSKNLKYSTDSAFNISEAFKLLSKNKYDVILLDYSLPGGTGLSQIEKIRDLQPFASIVMMTGQGNEAIAVEAIKSGADHYIIKSALSYETLIGTIESSLQSNLLERKVALQSIKIQAQRKDLFAARESYQAAVLSSGIGLWDWHIKQGSFYTSPKLKEILGYSEDFDIPGLEQVLERIHPDQRERVHKAIMERHLENREPFKEEFQVKNASGEYFWARMRGQAFWNKRDTPLRMSGSFDDISSEKASEEARIETDDFLTLFMEKNPNVIFVKDENFNVVKSNQAFKELYCIDPDADFVPRSHFEPHNGENLGSFFKSDEIALEKGSSENYVDALFPNGQRVILWVQKFRFEGASGKRLILCLGRDVTEREEMIRKLKISNVELASFAYLASHDLLEPLRLIVSFNELIKYDLGDKITPDANKYLDFSMDAAKRMRALIDDLLEYSTIDRDVEEYIEVDAQKALEDALMNLKEKIDLKQAEITFTSLPQVKWSLIRLTRVFQNLIGNAIKFHQEGQKPNIHISAEEESNEWVFSVKDKGIGMDEEDTEKVFLPFHRTKATKGLEGSGIGLASSKKLISSMGGKIWVESKLGSGSTFFFTILKQ